MKGFGSAVVRLRIPILILAVLLLIPAAIGYFNTRTNYDILTYLPKEIETMKGQDILAEDFGTGAFSMVVVEDMKSKDIKAMAARMEEVEHVKRVLWYGSLVDISIPEDILPSRFQKALKNGEATLMIAIFDSTMSSDATMKAIADLREIVSDQTYISGMSAMIVDTKDLSDKEVPIYVVIAVVLCLLILTLTMDSFMVPLFFLLSIGCAVVYNLGSNFIQGEISYVTKALAAVLQLAVTMDYSIFLWHSYTAEKAVCHGDRKSAMAAAINETLTSVVGSSITTVAGFVALMFMSFTMGLDLGIVMAKGVIIGVICCVTVLPSLILFFDKAIEKTSHKPLLPDLSRISKWIVKHFYIGLILFAALIVPAFYGQSHNEVYYDLDVSLPKDLPSIVANAKLDEKFEMSSTHLILLDSNLPSKKVRSLVKELEEVKGVKAAIGLDSLVGPLFPMDFIPDRLKDVLDNGEYKLLFILSEYKVASDEVNAQCDTINEILDKYDEKGMLIGEAPCTEDLIKITDHDFKVVNFVSILLVGLIIIMVFRSISLPVLLVSVIEFAIFINMGIPYYMGTVLPFVASIVIGTIQLGSTVDYAILMTSKYKSARASGAEKLDAVTTALSESMNSIIVSALTFFAATIGVGLYSNIDMISSLCRLMARGAIISMFVVILLLPAVLRVFDPVILHTTMGFGNVKRNRKKVDRETETV
ncbi:MAG: MMPL family transporter [Eubacterium sp.]|nr:MMPL family transporter [Eubacterium sp.]